MNIKKLVIFLIFSCFSITGIILLYGEYMKVTNSKRNRLGEEKSPYLLQHKNNPIHWYSWGEEPIEQAKKEDKVIFLSIGYSTCYWCHVMEKESFEDREVATILNENFISIKVDREERPDIDEIYMDAVVSMTGQGGWPMSVFLTPDGRAFFGGTYFPKKYFLDILHNVNHLWKNNKQEVLASGEKLFQHLKKQLELPNSNTIDLSVFEKAKKQLLERFDEKYGGFGGAPKFPPSMEIALLIRMHKKNPNPQMLKIITETLNKMACGGIYDQVGGGFHRYSTDILWFEPHFEKMLYSNALLSFTYLEAWQITKDNFYKEIARETLDYVLREMTSKEGAFYSAQDAGELNREGEYYTWSLEEIKKIATKDEWATFSSVYELKDTGNFHNKKNILWIQECNKRKYRNKPLITSVKNKLLSMREKRFHLHKDDKILTSWNALMIASFAKAYQVTREEKYLKAAQAAATFIKDNLWKKGKLFHRYREKNIKYSATIDDYSFLVFALLELYETNADTQWLKWSEAVQALQDKNLWDSKNGGYYTSEAADKTIIYRKKDINDGALPSGNAIAATNLLKLYRYTLKKNYKDKVKQQLHFLSGGIERYPSGFPQILQAFDFYLSETKEIVVVGNNEDKVFKELKNWFYETFLPNKISIFLDEAEIKNTENPFPTLLIGKKKMHEHFTAYVCQNHTCKKPAGTIEEFKKQLNVK